MPKKQNGVFNLIIGLSGPYGAGCSSLVEDMRRIIIDWPGCLVEIIHVADLIQTYYSVVTGKSLDLNNDQNKSERREKLQNAGTMMRKKDLEIVGKLIMSEIYDRGVKLEENKKLEGIGTIIFIVDSIKNRNELELLRKSYQGEFFMLFLHSERETRWRRMVDYKSWQDKHRVRFEQRDAVDQDEKTVDESVGDAGQQVGKLAGLGDYYIVNDQNRENLQNEGERVINLLFGGSKNQPTLQERSMHIAFSASNRSFCLSRQVGAAIVDKKGDLLGVGHNDVPKALGGLYNQEDKNDKRCYLVGDRRCINHVNKEERFKELSNSIVDKLKEEVVDGIVKKLEKNLAKNFQEEFNIDDDFKQELKELIDKSPFREATEYCRAVHAEMEALLSVSRTSRSPVGATIYVTTEPCHNCTKHIICSGIEKVVYMEPYPKSLGIELHSDAIYQGSNTSACPEGKILFTSYQGAAPHRYHDFFELIDDRKDDDGKYRRKSNEHRSETPRFSRYLVQRVRKTMTPDPITTYEMKCSNEISAMIDKFNKKITTKAEKPKNKSKGGSKGEKAHSNPGGGREA